MDIIFRENGYEGKTIKFNALSYIFRTDTSITLEKENIGLWNLMYDGKSLYLYEKKFVRDDDEVIYFEDEEKKLVATHTGNGDFIDGEGLTFLSVLYDNVIDRVPLVNFLVDALKTNKRMYKLFLFDSSFASAVERKRRNAGYDVCVPMNFFRNIIASGLNSLEKVYTGCSAAFFVENICNTDMGLANDKKKLRQVLGLPAAVIEFLKGEEYVSLYPKFKELAEQKDVNDAVFLVEYLSEIIRFEHASRIFSRGSKSSFVSEVLDISLMTKSSMKVILNYLHTQAFSYGDSGIGGVQLPQSEAVAMRDYLMIAKKHNLDVDPLPSNLRAAHFYIQNNVCYADDEEKNASFKKAVDKYRYLEFSDETYSVIVPNDIEAMIDEGMQMHHCIANYVDMVCQGTIVLFLRKKESIGESFVSFEVAEDGEFVQIKGKYDVDIEAKPEEEAEENAILAFLDKWREKKFVKEED